jgi:hypothetical protein
MRVRHRGLFIVSIFASMAALATSNCSLVARYFACDVDPDCDPTGVGGNGGAGGQINPGCVPSENSEPVDTNCGVFVSSSLGDDGSGDGSQGAPFKTLAKAVALAETARQPVYACAESFGEAVTLPAGLVLYGGLECGGGWRYAGGASKTRIEPDADVIGLRLRGGGSAATHVEDVVVTAKDATTDGGSSIAALAESGAEVELVRCELAAGSGKAGAVGATPSEPVGPSDPNDMTVRGENGAAACMGNMSGTLGGAGKLNELCQSVTIEGMVVGGDGGTGQVANGGNGADGQPLPNPNPTGKGLGGVGDDGSGIGCETGKQGANGKIGSAGIGAAITSLGTLSEAGLQGADGEAGKEGAPGQGGGGGGGAKGKLNCNGASGGGGGAGGCGGKGGLGGQAGGSSIALVSLGATLTFTEVKLIAANGGDGGEGGAGQSGGSGGNGGNGGIGSGTLDACNGGKGGQGGFGGKGGGGRGGHSLGIAYTGATPSTAGTTIMMGTPGQGGAGADASGQGAYGVKEETQAFP